MSDTRSISTPDLSPYEETMLQIFRDALQCRDIGLHESFLELGGDSMGAMLCISRIRLAFGVEPSFDDFFLDDATVYEFARRFGMQPPPGA